ncbi:MAG TPA: YciI family protein [Gemmatimonadales bacterium]|jgi:hypothetical protein|nr:YciI family protein [Gemmatimonadales bacterium]
MPEFLYIYRGTQRPSDPQEGQQILQKWMSWLEGLAKQGKLKDRGQPLEPTGKVVNGRAKTVTDGPYAEAKDLVGGFSLVEARDLDEAVELSKGCPALERGGTVEVRPLMKI